MVGTLLWILLAGAAELGPTEEFDVLADGRGIVSQRESDTGAARCSDQSLTGGVALPELPLFFTRVNPGAEWGSDTMIGAIVSAARHMRWLLPDASPITIGDISREHGGALSGHDSHRGGVDADIGVYSLGGKQNGRGFDSPGPSFDVAANWSLIAALLDTGDIDFILLDRAHIARLRKHTLLGGLLTEEEVEEVFPTGDRLWERTGIVRHAKNHDNHLHVRVLCADGSQAR